MSIVPPAVLTGASQDQRIKSRSRQKIKERIIFALLAGAASFTVFITLAIIVLLAIARAVGETMIAAIAAGNSPRETTSAGTIFDVTKENQTMTGFMAQMAGGDVSNFEVEYYSMYAVGMMLFLVTFTLTCIGGVIRKRFREVYH